MGVVGLTNTLKKYRVYRRQNIFYGGVFYVDVMNLFHDIGEQAERRRPDPKNKDVRIIEIIEQELAYFRRLNPSKIYLVADAYFPVDKIPIKVARKRARLWAQKKPTVIASVFRWLVQQNFADIELIFSGLEGETAIMQHIYETTQLTRTIKKFIFSDDSDIYTFNLPDKSTVYGVPLKARFTMGADTICMQDAWHSVNGRYHVALPIEQIPESVSNPKGRILSLIETVNLIAYNSMFTVFILAFPTPYITNAAFIGERYRRVKNAHILNLYFHGRDMEISEYLENGFDIVCQKVEKASPEEVKAVFRDILTVPMPTLIYNEFKRTQAEHNFSDAEIDAIYRFCTDTLHGKAKTGTAPSFRTLQAKDLLYHLLLAIKLLISITLVPRSMGELDNKLDEFELCAYIA